MMWVEIQTTALQTLDVVITMFVVSQDENGQEIESQPILPCRQKLFFRGNDAAVARAMAKVHSDMDKDMLERKYIRRPIALYTK